MTNSSESDAALLQENAELRARLEEAEETLRAIQAGEVDALVLGEEVYTLKGAETPYRVLIEQMYEGAGTILDDGTVLYANRRLGELLRTPLQELIGTSLRRFVAPPELPAFDKLLVECKQCASNGEFTLQCPDGSALPVQLSFSVVHDQTTRPICVTATDLTERKRSEQALRQAHDSLEQRVNQRTAELQQASVSLRESESAQRRQREFLERVIVNAGSCIAVVKGRELRYTLANPAFQTVAAGGPMVGRTYREVFPEAAAAGAEARIQQVLDTGEAWIVDDYAAPIPGKPDAIWQGHIVRLPLVVGEEPSALVVVWDITTRKQADEALRRLSERDAFLVALADALRPLANVGEIKSTAARVLGQHLRASRVAYAEVTPDGDVIVERGYANGIADIPGRYRLDDYGPALLPEIRAGRNIVVADVASAPGYTEQEKARYAAVQVAANLNVPLLKNGRPVALLAVHQAAPRQWTDAEVLLVTETVERTWATVERARAEHALQVSNKELALFNSLMVGRELRMIELKKEIDELCVQFGQPPRYG